MPGNSLERKAPPYFTASPLKFVLLSVLTFGYYEFYWFYRNWSIYKARTGKRVMPVWRAIFAPLWVYTMFADIHDRAREYGLMFKTSAPMLALAYVLLFIVHFLPEPVAFFSVLTVVPLLLANNLASLINAAAVPDYRENSRFGFLNIVAIIFGVLTLAFKTAFLFVDAPSLADSGLAELGVRPGLIRLLNN